MTNRVPRDDGHDEAMTRTSALIIAGQDIGRYHIGVRAHSRTTAAGLLPVSLLAQQRLTEPVELGDHLLRRRSNSLTGPFAQLLKLAGRPQPGFERPPRRPPGYVPPAWPHAPRRADPWSRRGLRGSSHGTRSSPLRAGPVHSRHPPRSSARPGRSNPGRPQTRAHRGDIAGPGQQPVTMSRAAASCT
jgi:hypothetical protein